MVPNPGNGFIDIVIAHDTFPEGSKATFQVQSKTLPLNPELEFFVSATLNSAAQRIDRVADRVWSGQTPSLVGGMNSIVASVYQQPKREASRIKKAVDALSQDIYRYNQELAIETDPEKISQIKAAMDAASKEIAILEGRLRAIRKKLGGDVEVLFFVI